jgi:hypothetical protein
VYPLLGNKTLRKTPGREFVKREPGYPAGYEKELDVVEGSVPSKTEKEIANGVGDRNVGAPDTGDSFSPLLEKKNSG